MNSLTLYLAHPISGMTLEEVSGYYKEKRLELKNCVPHLKVLMPVMANQKVRTDLECRENGTNNPLGTNHHIIERDRWMVKQSDIVFVNLMSATERVSIGSMMELAWAHDNGIHTIVAMGPDNTHRHGFVMEAADTVFDNSEDALEYIKQLTSEIIYGHFFESYTVDMHKIHRKVLGS